jgi:hypothetical protein
MTPYSSSYTSVKHVCNADAQPVMPHAVDSGRRISCWIILICRNRIRPKPEELAAAGPMKCSWTRRVCTLGMLLLVQGCSPQHSTSSRRLFAVSLSSRCPFFFQTLNGGL